MRVFVTGATGWIGSAVVKDLLSSGHKVSGLTTTTGGAQKLQALGAKARVGRLQDHALLREGAATWCVRLRFGEPAFGLPSASGRAAAPRDGSPSRT